MTTDIGLIFETINSGGAIAILVAYMIWDKIQTRKDREAAECLRLEERKLEQQKNDEERQRSNLALEKLGQASELIANTLELLKKQMETNDTLLRRHDDRSIGIDQHVIAIDNKIDNVIGIVSSCRKK